MLYGKSRITVALDNDADSLALLKSETNAVVPIQASAHCLPIRSGSVDSVLLLDVLEHVSDDHRAIEEAARVLCKDGTLVLSVPNRGVFSFLDPQNLSAMFRGKKDPAKFHRHYSYEDLSRVLCRDFTIERKHYGGLFLYPLSFALDHSIKKYLDVDLSQFFKRLGDWDNDVSWGKLSYNVILKAKKL
jgi:ubiquinone/menaquinone biosynthesis C-methylase UbiE